jgi:hypothetical protein
MVHHRFHISEEKGCHGNLQTRGTHHKSFTFPEGKEMVLLREHKIHRQGSCFNSEIGRLSKGGFLSDRREPKLPSTGPDSFLSGRLSKSGSLFQKTRTEAPIDQSGFLPSQQVLPPELTNLPDP